MWNYPFWIITSKKIAKIAKNIKTRLAILRVPLDFAYKYGYVAYLLDRFFLRNEAKIRNMRNDHQIWKFFLRNGCSPIKKIKILFAQWDITDVTENILFAQWNISLSEIHFLILFAQWANLSHRTEFVEFELINVLEYQGNWNSIIKD